jgi:hypothetical protein
MDERKIGRWLADSGKSAGQAVAAGAGKVANTVGPAVSSGAQKAGRTAKSGVQTYWRWFVSFWRAIFRFIGSIFRFIWLVISFIPRKIIGLFRRKKQPVRE